MFCYSLLYVFMMLRTSVTFVLCMQPMVYYLHAFNYWINMNYNQNNILKKKTQLDLLSKPCYVLFYCKQLLLKKLACCTLAFFLQMHTMWKSPKLLPLPTPRRQSQSSTTLQHNASFLVAYPIDPRTPIADIDQGHEQTPWLGDARRQYNSMQPNLYSTDPLLADSTANFKMHKLPKQVSPLLSYQRLHLVSTTYSRESISASTPNKSRPKFRAGQNPSPWKPPMKRKSNISKVRPLSFALLLFWVDFGCSKVASKHNCLWLLSTMVSDLYI